MKSLQEEIANLKSSSSKIAEKDNLLEQLNKTLLEKDKEIESQKARIDEIQAELNELKPPEIGTGGFVSEERITCPMCGAVGQNIKSVEDKTRILSYVGHIPMYAKKNVCKKCGYEF
jgi:uncharacterized coiled-coil protein SlyX